MKWVRENSLTLFFLAIFLATVVGQALVGHSDYNHAQIAHQNPTVSLGRYVTSSPFWADVMENWQSEYLQFTLYIVATIWLLQRGSSESKEPGKAGLESDADQRVGRHAGDDSPRWARGGWRTALYSNSLLALMALVWVGSWGAQAVAGRVSYNAEQLDHHEAAVSLVQYVGTSDFWDRDAPELAIGVPGGGLDGRPVHLPASARLPGVQAGRRPARGDRRRVLGHY
ncbi:MAG TPA: DUF6766 family protein [Solirubrobacteraceae bacterium]|nr:DUF6766 family protein [Solirubrobacteraceae bacterium]